MFLGAAYRGDVGFEVLGQLHACGADGAGRAVDEDPLPFPEISLSQAPECIEPSVANRRGLLEAHAGRLVGDSRALPHADELRVCPEPEPACAEDLVADGEFGDRHAGRFDLARQLAAEDPLLRSADARDGAADERDGQAATPVGFTSRAVRPGDRRGADLDEDLVLFGDGPLDLFDMQNVRWPVSVIYDRSHEPSLRLTQERSAAGAKPRAVGGAGERVVREPRAPRGPTSGVSEASDTKVGRVRRAHGPEPETGPTTRVRWLRTQPSSGATAATMARSCGRTFEVSNLRTFAVMRVSSSAMVIGGFSPFFDGIQRTGLQRATTTCLR